MSADLFAEFGSFDTGSTKQSNQTLQTNIPSQPVTKAIDPFDFSYLTSPTSRTASPQTFPPSQPWPNFQSQSSGNSWGNTANTQPVQETADDDWGDFEEAPPSATTAKPQTTFPQPPNSSLSMNARGAKAPPQVSSRTRILRASTLDLMTNNLVHVQSPATKGKGKELKSWPEQRSPSIPSPVPESSPEYQTTRPKNVDPNVLFDADDFDEQQLDEDDDFGDFEIGEEIKPKPNPAVEDLISIDFGASATQTKPPVSAPSNGRKAPPSQLLGLDVLPLSPMYPQAPRSPSFSDRNPFPGMAITTPVSATFPTETKAVNKEKVPSPVTAWPEAQSARTRKDSFDKDWDAFADFPTDMATPGGPSAISRSSTWDWDGGDSPQPAPMAASKPVQQISESPEIETIGPPPTNIPPPSILLSILPQLLEEVNTSLYKPTATQTQAVKARIFADPATIAYVRGYLVLATVAARILVGRKLRWHRDKFLSQSMTISAAGGKGGMKLAGVDKAQSKREDREAADVVGIWRDHVGRLKSAVAAANLGLQKQVVKMEPMKVPEINDHMTVTTAKVVPQAPKACVICGLKRDERVKGVDLEVEDSFGEWWVEHWGHRACRNWWLEHEGALRQR